MIVALEEAKYKLQNMRADIDELHSALRIDELVKQVEDDEKSENHQFNPLLSTKNVDG